MSVSVLMSLFKFLSDLFEPNMEFIKDPKIHQHTSAELIKYSGD